MSDAPGWSGYHWDKGAGDILMSTYVWPIRDKKGRLQSILSGDLSLSFLDQELSKLSLERRDKQIVISNRNTGEVVLPAQDIHCIVANTASKFSKNVVAKSIQKFYIGENKYYLYTFPNEKQNWSINVIFSYAAVQNKLVKLNRATAGIAIIGIAMVIVMLVVVQETIKAPLEQLSGYIRGLNFSRYNLPVPYTANHDEIGVLAKSFLKFKNNIYTEFQSLIDATANKRLQQYEQKVAEDIRNRLLPHPLTFYVEGWQGQVLGAQFYNRSDLGGDYFDYFIIDNRYLVIYIAEIATVGVEVALFMGRLRTFIRAKYINPHTPPEFVLSQLNNFWCERNEKCIYVNLHLSTIDLKLGIHHYCSAGFNSNMMVGAPEFQVDAQPSIAIGMAYNEPYYSATRHLPDEYTLLLYTNSVLKTKKTDNHEALQALFNKLNEQENVLELEEAVHTLWSQSDCVNELTFLVLHLKKE